MSHNLKPNTAVSLIFIVFGSIVTLEDDDSIAVKVRGPVQNEKECFFFLEEILGCVDQVRHTVETSQIKKHGILGHSITAKWLDLVTNDVVRSMEDVKGFNLTCIMSLLEFKI